MAMSYTTQAHLRKVAGINTANTRRREIGGEMTGRPYDIQSMGREDPEHLSDDDIEAQLRAIEPQELQRFRRASPGGRATALARGPTVHPQQARVDRVEAELERLGPGVRPILGKLDAADWDLSRLSDAEWELYKDYLRLEKELRRLKGFPLAGVDDRGVAAGAGQHFRR
jgi:hypothetical protein